MRFAIEQSPRSKYVPPLAGLASNGAAQRIRTVAREAITRRTEVIANVVRPTGGA